MADTESIKTGLGNELERSAVALLNTDRGGLLRIGADENGNPLATESVELVRCQIIDRIRENISPSALGLCDVVVEKREGAPAIKVVVASGWEKPYYVWYQREKGCFGCIGNEVQPMTAQMISELRERRRPILLGNTPSPRRGLTFCDLQIYYLEKKLKLDDGFKTTLELLTPDGADNYVAYLLADENGVSVKVAKYAGKSKVNLVTNDEYGYCCLARAANRVLDRLNAENLKRKKVDMIALREAVINAIVHNDYSSNAMPTVEIFSDRITVTSYVGLPDYRESFFERCSMPRNRELMRVFLDLGLVDELGSGLKRILGAYDKSAFEFIGNFLVVTFRFA
ncbi:MAG: transcriptional regulator [Clostridiales bacterium]|jgi:predicted HTH transcriptional regulator|nr:transcriptional regulator [Clostridiales bacterium]